MRSIINISLPQQMAELIREEVGTGKYGSVSEFFRELVRDWQENQILKDLRKSQEEIRRGKGKLLHSLRDLR